jgi:NADPH:quinone reductase-like Zn-dependent oxidoreductase
LQELPDPIPGPNELLIRVAIAAVNPVDWKLRDLYARPKPFTLGQDVAGTVVAVGADVKKFAYGDRVAGIAREHGGYTDLTLIPAADPTQPLGHIPAGVGDADAAALLTPGLTAVECAEKAGGAPGKRILIVGVMGAVGQITAQLVSRSGADVIGVGHSGSEGQARALGLKDYLAYDGIKENSVPDAARTRFAREIDVVIDLVSDARTIIAWAQAIKPGGLLLSTNHAFDDKPTLPDNVRAENANLNDGGSKTAERLRDLFKLVEQGELRIPIGKEYDFRSAVTALNAVKSGETRGKALIIIGD